MSNDVSITIKQRNSWSEDMDYWLTVNGNRYLMPKEDAQALFKVLQKKAGEQVLEKAVERIEPVLVELLVKGKLTINDARGIQLAVLER